MNIHPLSGIGRKLYLYSDMRGGLAFASSLSEWRQILRKSKEEQAWRCAVDPGAVNIPQGYQLVGNGLACEGIERIE